MLRLDDLTSPEAASTALTVALAERRRDLRDQTRDRPLTLTAPAGLPADLAERIAAHNEAAARHEEREARHDEATAALPLRLTDREMTAAKIAREAGALRCEGLDLARAAHALSVARGGMAAEAAEALERLALDAEGVLAKKVNEAKAALQAAGWRPLSARRSGDGAQPAIEARQWNQAAGETKDVAAAEAALTDLRAAGSALRDVERATAADAAIRLTAVMRAWVLVAGALA